jgi:hypothetical protein
MAQTVSGATNDNGTTGTVAADEVVTKIELDTRSLLERLDLIGTPADQAAAAKAGAFFFGPANSVAIIESQATALSKWWSAGLGAGVVAAWGAVRVFWNTNPPVHGVLLWGASIVSAALLLAIAIIVASDVLSRGRGAAATVQARAEVARALIRATAEGLTGAPAGVAAATSQVVPITTPKKVRNIEADGPAEEGWTALLAQYPNGPTGTPARYFVAKGSKQEWVDANLIQFN